MPIKARTLSPILGIYDEEGDKVDLEVYGAGAKSRQPPQVGKGSRTSSNYRETTPATPQGRNSSYEPVDASNRDGDTNKQSKALGKAVVGGGGGSPATTPDTSGGGGSSGYRRADPSMREIEDERFASLGPLTVPEGMDPKTAGRSLDNYRQYKPSGYYKYGPGKHPDLKEDLIGYKHKEAPKGYEWDDSAYEAAIAKTWTPAHYDNEPWHQKLYRAQRIQRYHREHNPAVLRKIDPDKKEYDDDDDDTKTYDRGM